jgi:hypothetical protein
MAKKPAAASSTSKKSKSDKVSVTSPLCTFIWPNLSSIDYGTDKYPKEDGEYNVRGSLDGSDKTVRAFMKKLDDLVTISKDAAEEAFSELPIKSRKEIEAKGGVRAGNPYNVVYDEETEQPTGMIEFRAKMKASGTRKKDGTVWTSKPALFDAFARPLPKGVKISGGTKGYVAFDCVPYFVAATGEYGIAKYLTGVQIIELVSGGQRSADSLGFAAQEGGFDASTFTAEDDSDTPIKASKGVQAHIAYAEDDDSGETVDF